jgi:hypothetical protein
MNPNKSSPSRNNFALKVAPPQRPLLCKHSSPRFSSAECAVGTLQSQLLKKDAELEEMKATLTETIQKVRANILWL